jgi:phosphate transport system substrate-binding protein
VLLAGALACVAGEAAAQACAPYRPQPLTIAADAPYLDAEGAVRVVGYNDMAEMVAGLDRAFAAAHAGLTLHPDLRGTRAAPAALAAGSSAFGPMGAPFSPEQLAAYRASLGADPVGFRIAHASFNPRALSGPLAVFVQRDNPLAAAALPRIAKIFTDGRPHTWSELGLKGAWARRPIHLTGLAPDRAMAVELQERAFAGRPYASGYQGLQQSAEVVSRVGGDPLALGFGALNRGDAHVKALALAPTPGGTAVAPTEASVRAGRYPLDRHLYIYVRPRPDGSLDPVARDYLALALSCEGQAIVSAGSLGYLPLNARELAAERARLR